MNHFLKNYYHCVCHGYGDPVYAIRAAVNNLKELTVIFGSEWAQVEIINRLLNQGDKIDNDDGNGDNNDNDNKLIIQISLLE